MPWYLALAAVLQLALYAPAAARIQSSGPVPLSQAQGTASDSAAAAPVKLQVDGDDDIVVKRAEGSIMNSSIMNSSIMNTSQDINLQRAHPAIAMGLPPNAYSFGVQEAEHHQTRANQHLHPNQEAVGPKDHPMSRLPSVSGGPYHGLWHFPDGSNRISHKDQVNYSEAAYSFLLLQWKLIVYVFLGCFIGTFLLGPVFGCFGLLCDFSFVSFILTKVGYRKDSSHRSSHDDAIA